MNKIVRKILLTFSFGIIFLLVLVLFNTYKYPSSIPTYDAVPLNDLPESALQHLSELVQIKSLSKSEDAAIDTAEFEKLKAHLEKNYPLLHQQLERQIFNRFTYLYTWVGSNPKLQPYVLMAHSDVVPIEEGTEKNWELAPFSGAIKNGSVWGRGTLDDKASLTGILEAVEHLLSKNFKPKRTVYLCFGHDEELSGKNGTALIAKWFVNHNIIPELVLDEGGEVNTSQLKEINRPIALLGISEKGFASFNLSVIKMGGHSSIPEKETAIDILSKALVKLRSKQMPAKLTEPVQEMLNTIGPGLNFKNRLAFANLWLLESFMIHKMETSKEANALIHSTIVPSLFYSGLKDNVVPSKAEAIVNSRILPGETSSSVELFIRQTIADNRVEIKLIKETVREASPITPIQGIAYKKLNKIVQRLIPDVVVSPFLVLGATDSRYFRPFSKGVINFMPFSNSKGVHGDNEKISIEDFNRIFNFYEKIISSD